MVEINRSINLSCSKNVGSDDTVYRLYKQISSGATIDVFDRATKEKISEVIGCSCPGYEKHGNALIYAVHLGADEANRLLDAIGDSLLMREHEIFWQCNKTGENVFRILIKKMIDAPSKDLENLLKRFGYYSPYMDCSPLTARANDGHTALTLAARNEYKGNRQFFKLLLNQLSSKIRMTELSKLHKIAGETDDHGQNLLMIALKGDGKKSNLQAVKAILDIVKTSGSVHSRELMAFGVERKTQTAPSTSREELPPHSEYKNSLLLALEGKQFGYLQKILKTCVSPAKQWSAVLQTQGTERRSALGELIKADKISELKMLLAESSIRDSAKQMLANTVARKQFISQPMSLKVIQVFHEARIFSEMYLAPKPSEHSEPCTLVFHNSFNYSFCDTCSLETQDTRKEVHDLSTALEHLGWNLVNDNAIESWTFNDMLVTLRKQLQLVKARKNTSALMLFISSLGSSDFVLGHKAHRPRSQQAPEEACCYTTGKRNEIEEVLHSELDVTTPKIIVLDVRGYKPSDEETSVTLSHKPNMVLSRWRDCGHNYLKHLVEAIQNADGVTTLMEMHEQVQCRALAEMQHTPATMPEDMQAIYLADDKQEGKCIECEKTSCEKCASCHLCSCQVCFECAGLPLEYEMSTNPHLAIICKYCQDLED